MKILLFVILICFSIVFFHAYFELDKDTIGKNAESSNAWNEVCLLHASSIEKKIISFAGRLYELKHPSINKIEYNDFLLVFIKNNEVNRIHRIPRKNIADIHLDSKLCSNTNPLDLEYVNCTNTSNRCFYLKLN